ncbi:MAG: hypothetical protein ACR2MX_16750 [Cyclobacteriaceae bacterium]
MYQISELLFIFFPLLCIGFIMNRLWYLLTKCDFEDARKKRVFATLTIVVTLWVVLISSLSFTDFFSDFSTFPPRLGPVLLLPLLAVLILTFTGRLDAILKLIPPPWLIYMQTFRVGVELMIWLLFIQNLLPIQMTFEGRNWDILVGLTAPLFGYYCFVKKRWSKAVAIIWNIAGLVLLANIVTIALLSMPTPARVFMNEPANTIVAEFPYIWLPGILVAIAYIFHILSLRQLTKNLYTKASSNIQSENSADYL